MFVGDCTCSTTVVTVDGEVTIVGTNWLLGICRVWPPSGGCTDDIGLSMMTDVLAS